jgi:hypothetical protein
MPDPIHTESRTAFHELIDKLRELDARYLGPEHRIATPMDVSDGHRAVLHILQGALNLVLEADPEWPAFRRTVRPNMKFLGDNPDALYYTAFIQPDRRYRIRGNLAGATFTSFSLERGTADGHTSKGVAQVIVDEDLKAAPDGSFELLLSPEPPADTSAAWLRLEPGVGSVQSRHFFERERPVANDPSKEIPLSIEPLDPPGPRNPPDDNAVAASIRRVSNFLHDTTLGLPMMQDGKIPSWVSIVPNKFNPPEIPAGDIGFANRSAAYAMAPYMIGPEQALILEGRFPKCRFANVMLWNRFLQTYDYETHNISLNRKQTQQAPDGSFRMIVAHKDPGVPNWLDTQGKPFGLIYWRFVMPQETVPPVTARVVKHAEIPGSGR